MDGVFPMLVVVGLFLLIVAVVVGIVVLVRRDRSTLSRTHQPRPVADAMTRDSAQPAVSQLTRQAKDARGDLAAKRGPAVASQQAADPEARARAEEELTALRA